MNQLHKPVPIRLAIAVLLALSTGACKDDNATPQAGNAANTIEPKVSAESVEKSLSAAQTYLGSRDVEKAQAILNLLIDRAPQESRAFELLGQSYTLEAMIAQERGEIGRIHDLRSKAYEQYRAAVAFAPDSAGLHHSAGQIALAAGNVTVALEHFQAAGRIDPANAQYPLFEAQLLIQRKEYPAAKAALERVLAIDPDEAFALASLAMIAVEEDDFDTAIAHMQRARQVQPHDLGLRAQEAKIHRRKGDPQRGLELLIGLGDADRARQYVATELASCYEQLGQMMNAAKVWQHVHQTDATAPGTWLAAVHVCEYLILAGEREQALLWLEQARIAAPNAPQVLALQEALVAMSE